MTNEMRDSRRDLIALRVKLGEARRESMSPTIEERYQHLRENAESFVRHAQAMVTAAQERGEDDMATKLRVWCLMPWQAAIKADDAGDLWPICEHCGEPIKNDAERVSGDACDFHKVCISAFQ